jgi:hypothetical protein
VVFRKRETLPIESNLFFFLSFQIPSLTCSLYIFVQYTLKEKVFYETKKRSSPCHTGRSFFGFAKRSFRMELVLREWEKWLRTKGSVRNLYRKKSKRFRTHGFVPNPSRIMFKRFRTDGFALNPFRIMSKRFRTDGFVQNPSEKSLKKVSSRWFRTKPFKAYSTHEEALPTEKSFSS